MEAYKSYTKITSKYRLLDLNLGEVWEYRDLIILFTKRSFSVSFKQTILGPLWLFLNPLLSSVMYMIVFGNIARLGTDGLPQMLFYLSGNALWGYFSACVTRNATTFTENAPLFGKVYFPRLVIPISNMLSAVIRFLIQMLMVVGLLIYYVVLGTVHVRPAVVLFLPLILIWMGVLGVGTGIIISSLTTKYRDLGILVTFGIQLWMYGTPVVYPLSTVGGTLKMFILLNPVSAPMELFRWALLGVGNPVPWSVAVSAAVTVVIAFAGIILFNKVERNFMDIV